MIRSLADLPELSQRVSGLIRLPFGQDVPFTPRVRAVVETAAFQRLRHVAQLGLAAAVYPGAVHTRFEHALGVFHNAVQYLDRLSCDARFAAIVDPHAAEVLLCAALLHDVGHWPFCHPIEDMRLPGLATHEEHAAQWLDEPELADALRSHWHVEPDEVLDVLEGDGGPPAVRLVRSILSGPIDIDKLDYLERDSLHAGVPYGRNFDKGRLVGSLVVNEAGDGLAVSSKGKTAAELMVFARYVMFSEVYWHHAVRAATAMFCRAFYELRDRLDLPAFFRGTTADATAQMLRHAAETAWGPLAEGLFGPSRRLYKQVGEYGVFNAPELYGSIAGRHYADVARLAESLAGRLRTAGVEGLSPAEVLIDAPPPGREVEFKVDIFYPKEGVYRPLERVSPVTEALARRQFDDAVKRVRVFVGPERRKAVERLPDLAGLVSAAVAETFG